MEKTRYFRDFFGGQEKRIKNENTGEKQKNVFFGCRFKNVFFSPVSSHLGTNDQQGSHNRVKRTV